MNPRGNNPGRDGSPSRPPQPGRAPEDRVVGAPALRLNISPLSLLLPFQARFQSDRSRFKIGVFSRQTGKSFITAAEAVVDCLADPGTKWVCLSAGERQAR